MFVKVTTKISGKNKDRKIKSFRIVESVREGLKTKHKTIHFVGSSSKPEVISSLEKISQRWKIL